MHDVLMTFLNGDRSGVRELNVELGEKHAELTGQGVETLLRVLSERPGGITQQVFHLEYENTRLRECQVAAGGDPTTVRFGFASSESIDEY